MFASLCLIVVRMSYSSSTLPHNLPTDLLSPLKDQDPDSIAESVLGYCKVTAALLVKSSYLFEDFIKLLLRWFREGVCGLVCVGQCVGQCVWGQCGWTSVCAGGVCA